jgi:hypothetical protein
MAFKQETKNVFMVKSYIDNCPKGGVLGKQGVISRVETAMDVMKKKKEISGRAYGILIRYLRKKVPKEEPFYYSETGLVKRDGSLNLKKSTGKEQTMDELMSNLIND